MELRYGRASYVDRWMEWSAMMDWMSNGEVLTVDNIVVSLDVLVPGSEVVWGRVALDDIVRTYHERALGRPGALYF